MYKGNVSHKKLYTLQKFWTTFLTTQLHNWEYVIRTHAQWYPTVKDPKVNTQIFPEMGIDKINIVGVHVFICLI